MITLRRRSISQARMVNGPTLTISHRSDQGIGRALCSHGPLLGRFNGPTVEQFVGKYIQQLNKIADLDDIIASIAKDSDHLTFLSFYGDHELNCPTHLVICYLTYAYPRLFTDGRGYTTETDRYLGVLLNPTSS